MDQKSQEKAIAELNALYKKGTPFSKPIRKMIANSIRQGKSKAAVAQAVLQSDLYQKRTVATTGSDKPKKVRLKRPSVKIPKARGNFRWKPDVPVRLRTGELERQQTQHREFLRAEAERKVELRKLRAAREDAHEYVQAAIPREQLNDFRLWCVRTYGPKVDDLFEAVDAFIAAHPSVSDIQPASQLELIEAEPEPIRAEIVAPVVALPASPVKAKRQGKDVTVTSRPDQAAFSDAVRWNCFDRCVITGASLRQRTEAAHIMPHSAGGVDDRSNGLLLRRDIHELFDADMIAVCPVTLVIHVRTDALVADADLAAFHGLRIADTRQPINPQYLVGRWDTFQRLNAA